MDTATSHGFGFVPGFESSARCALGVQDSPVRTSRLWQLAGEAGEQQYPSHRTSSVTSDPLRTFASPVSLYPIPLPPDHSPYLPPHPHRPRNAQQPRDRPLQIHPHNRPHPQHPQPRSLPHHFQVALRRRHVDERDPCEEGGGEEEELEEEGSEERTGAGGEKGEEVDCCAFELARG